LVGHRSDDDIIFFDLTFPTYHHHHHPADTSICRNCLPGRSSGLCYSTTFSAKATLYPRGITCQRIYRQIHFDLIEELILNHAQRSICNGSWRVELLQRIYDLEILTNLLQEHRRHTTAAICQSDNRRVLLKVVVSLFRQLSAINEHKVHTWLLSDGRENDPDNHTILILEILRFSVDMKSASGSVTVHHPNESRCILHVLPWLEALDDNGPYLRFQSVIFIKHMLEVWCLPSRLRRSI